MCETCFLNRIRSSKHYVDSVITMSNYKSFNDADTNCVSILMTDGDFTEIDRAGLVVLCRYGFVRTRCRSGPNAGKVLVKLF